MAAHLGGVDNQKDLLNGGGRSLTPSSPFFIGLVIDDTARVGVAEGWREGGGLRARCIQLKSQSEPRCPPTLEAVGGRDEWVNAYRKRERKRGYKVQDR